MLHHVVMFRFDDQVEDRTIAELKRDMLLLPAKIAELRSYEVGTDAGLDDRSWDLVVVAQFDDAAGYQAYSQHPAHLPIVERIQRIMTDRAAVQTDDMA